MAARWFAFLVWALAAAAGVFWGLKIFARPSPVPAHAEVASRTLPPADVARVLGAPAAPVDEEEQAEGDADDGRFVLVGVVAARGAPSARDAVALIAVDGKPPRAYRVGATVDGDQVVQAVEQRSVQIGPRGGPARVALELPVRPPPATGVPGATAMPPASPMPPGTFLPPPGGARALPMRPGVAMPAPSPPEGAEDDADDTGDIEPAEPAGPGRTPGVLAR